MTKRSSWHRVDDADVPAEGRVRGTVLDGRPVALTRCGERLGALENRCPHQGGPVDEGSIENGYPAAMGAWAADPSRPVVAVTGDGGFGQYAMEITTAVKHGMPIKHVLLDNGALGKIEKEQVAADYPVWHTSLHNPDWAAYADLCGATGVRVDHRDQLDEAMRRMFFTDGPVLLCVQQDAALL